MVLIANQFFFFLKKLQYLRLPISVYHFQTHYFTGYIMFHCMVIISLKWILLQRAYDFLGWIYRKSITGSKSMNIFFLKLIGINWFPVYTCSISLHVYQQCLMMLISLSWNICFYLIKTWVQDTEKTLYWGLPKRRYVKTSHVFLICIFISNEFE